MRQAIDDRRRTLAAQEAELRVMMTKHEETEDMAANVETSTTKAKATAPFAKPAVPKGTAVVKGKATAQAGRGRSKGVPERAVALHVPSHGEGLQQAGT